MKFRLVEDLTDDEFIDKADRLVFEYYMTHPEAILVEMADFIGNKVKVESGLPFSFFISHKNVVHGTHGIRMKVLWNPSKFSGDGDGYLELHGDYDYVIGSHKYKPTSKELRRLRDFAKKYKVLFAAVWEGQLDYDDIRDYCYGRISFAELLNTLEFVDDFDVESIELYEFNHCKNVEDLERWVRKYSVFNMND